MLSLLFLGKEPRSIESRYRWSPHTHQSGELLVAGFDRMLLDDVIGDFVQAYRRFHQLFGVDAFHLNVDLSCSVRLLLVATIFHRELQNVLVFDGIGNHIGMQFLVKEILCGLLLAFVVRRVFAKMGVPVKPNIWWR